MRDTVYTKLDNSAHIYEDINSNHVLFICMYLIRHSLFLLFDNYLVITGQLTCE